MRLKPQDLEYFCKEEGDLVVRRRLMMRGAGFGLLLLLLVPFSFYAAKFGWRGLTQDLRAETYLWVPEQVETTRALMVHMITGAVITILVPVQAALGALGRAPRLHRGLGRVLVPLALATSAGGLIFIAQVGTIGGQLMDVGFTLYGALMLLVSLKLWQRAMEGNFAAHRDWALRLVVLALASWMYRVHYGLWYLMTGGWGSEPDFSGVFDQVQMFAFYAPYLLALEVWLRRQRA